MLCCFVFLRFLRMRKNRRKFKIKKFRGWLEEFLASLGDRGYADNTVRTYGIYLGEFFRYIEKQSLDLRKIDHRDIRAFLATLKKNKKRTVGLIVSIVRVFFRFCVRRKYLESNPAAVLVKPKFDEPLPVFLTEKEAAEFCQLPILVLRDKAIIEILYGSGIRVHELTAINGGDIDFNKKIIKVMGKGKRERLVLYGRRAARALGYYFRVRPLLEKSGPRPRAFF